MNARTGSDWYENTDGARTAQTQFEHGEETATLEEWSAPNSHVGMTLYIARVLLHGRVVAVVSDYISAAKSRDRVLRMLDEVAA